MAYANKVVAVAGQLQLIQSTKKSGSRKFLIKLSYSWNSRVTECDKLFDPEGHRRVSGGGARMWKFNTRKEAEELMSIAVLSGYSR